MTSVKLHHGDCLDVLRSMPDNSVDSIVTDPPYGLKFMGKKWDYDVPGVEVWAECLRVLKPGGHLLAFAGTRTQHRMACRIEDAGFELRDMVTFLYDTNETAQALIESLSPEQLKLLDATFGRDSMLAWSYGSGFPKSMDVSKAIDKAAGAEREVLGPNPHARPNQDGSRVWVGDKKGKEQTHPPLTAPATDAARQWQGWGTALKPALEPITVARKPFKGTVAANVLSHGAGAINIDGCRVAGGDDPAARYNGKPARGENANAYGAASKRDEVYQSSALGRWPANLIHDGSDEVVALFPSTGKSSGGGKKNGDKFGGGYAPSGADSIGYGDDGSAARFFYCAKASRKERNEGLTDPGPQFKHNGTLRQYENGAAEKKGNHHPTVKPTDLMAYLCRLVTPTGGTVLDPFMGSGSTGVAAVIEGFDFDGIEREAEYVEIARARIADAQKKADAA
ncbi:DNA-methyltransferase [Dickeya fangzhongdai]|uniref:DNA-methyltransferase n=1 Tax=Dickeya fangzhongdai TaxID=1778540 RepID=UPI0023E3C436|nr:DNA methyltransferase [Dickeya fangzhongdai]WES88791.1 DNA methyltransferase [Dickeya fangzhongdai]